PPADGAGEPATPGAVDDRGSEREPGPNLWADSPLRDSREVPQPRVIPEPEVAEVPAARAAAAARATPSRGRTTALRAVPQERAWGSAGAECTDGGHPDRSGRRAEGDAGRRAAGTGWAPERRRLTSRRPAPAVVG